MSNSLRRLVRDTINSALGLLNLKLVRRDGDFKDYIPFRQAIAGAKAAGLSMGDYVDLIHNVPGATQDTIAHMVELGVFRRKIERVCEVGPGSGRYLEKTVQLCGPISYEVYETADQWRKWLVKQYGVTAHQADGDSLSQTRSGSVDLVQAHKVFPGLSILMICRYFYEMARVTSDGGVVVFDLLTEGCLDEALLDKWLTCGYDYLSSMVPRQYSVNFFLSRGFSLSGSFFIPMKPGVTEYFIFTKQSLDNSPS